jgi:hypothetical protein
MLYWSPLSETINSFEPKAGWNASFSDKDKIAYTNLFFFLKNKKGFTDNIAETYSQMIIFKQKYPHLKYNNEQEMLLKEALRTVYN